MNKKQLSVIIRALLVTAAIWLVTLTGAAFELPDGAYIHIGDTAVYLAALLLPWQVAVPAAAVGCALADLTLGSVNYILATLIIKAVTVVVIKALLRLSEKPLTQDILVCLGGLVTVCGYYVADVLKALDNSRGFINAMSIAFDPIMYNVLQALICAVLYMALSGFVRKAVEDRKSKEETKEDEREEITFDA